MGTSVVDESSSHCDWLSENITSMIQDVYSYLASQDIPKLGDVLTKILIFIEPRGI